MVRVLKRVIEELELVITPTGQGFTMERILLQTMERLKLGLQMNSWLMRIKVGILSGQICNFLMIQASIFMLQVMVREDQLLYLKLLESCFQKIIMMTERRNGLGSTSRRMSW